MQVLFGVLLLVYVPNVDSYEGYIPLVDPIDDNKNEKPLGEHVCPERYANILSSKPSHFSFFVAIHFISIICCLLLDEEHTNYMILRDLSAFSSILTLFHRFICL